MLRGNVGSSRRMAAIFDRLAERWDIEHGPTSERADAFAVQVRYLTTHCTDLVRPRVLDIGCGTGQHLIRLMPWIGAGVGIDLSSRMVERAAANARAGQCRALRFLQQDAEELTHQRFGRFDLVLFVGVLEHLPAPAIALRKARWVLRPEGRIVIIMPHWLNPTHWWNRGDDRVPVRHLSLPALRAVAAHEGLALEQAVALPHGIDLLRPFGTHAERLFSGRLARAGAVLRGAFGVSLRHADGGP